MQELTLEKLESVRRAIEAEIDVAEIKKEISDKCDVFTVSYITKVYHVKSAVLYDYKTAKTLETARKWAKKYECEGFRCEILKKITTGFLITTGDVPC